MVVFSYLRVSGKGQVGGEGPDRQRDAVSSFAKSHGIEIRGEFFEAGVSGAVESMDRKAFSDMVEAIECRRVNGEEIEGIVVERIDRLARDLMVCELLCLECRKRGIKIFAADRGELVDLASDDGDPTRKLIRQVMGALAEWEKSQIVLKLRKAREAKKRKTGRCEGNKPFGHYPGEPQMMEFLRAAWVPGQTTLRTIAKMVNEAGFRTRWGNPWTHVSVWDVIQITKRKGN